MKIDVRLLYVDEFEAKKGNTPELEVGQVYRAMKRQAPTAGGFYQLILDEDVSGAYGMFIPKLETDTPFFSCKLREVSLDDLLTITKKEEIFERVSQWGVDLKDGLDEALFNLPTMHTLDRSKNISDQIASIVAKVQEEVGLDIPEVRVGDDINSVREREPEMGQTLDDLVRYVLSTYKDKYEASDTINPCIGVRYSEQHGKGANIHNSYKYIHRYMSDGFEKSNNPKDLLKAIHYLLFELTRLNINERD